MRIDDIIIGTRHRKDLGDIAGLARSIDDVGMLHPVVVRPDGILIAGERRIAAARMLGWTDIPATIIDLDAVMRGEIAENTQRKDFAPSEAVAIWQAMKSYQGQPRPETGRGEGRIDRAARATELSTDSLTKAKAVVDAAERDPERYASLVTQMDNTGNVARAHKEMTRERARENNREIVRQAPALDATGCTYPCIVIDPPWDWGDEGDADQLGRARPTYATMPLEDLMALPVGDVAEPNAHLYLWITNRSLPKGFALLEKWGFRYVTMLTWLKPSFGMGNYFRGSTEHVLFGVHGSLGLLRSDVGTHFAADRPGRHSGKPDAFYRLVETCSPGPWLEMFARERRPGWAAWGAEL